MPIVKKDLWTEIKDEEKNARVQNCWSARRLQSYPEVRCFYMDRGWLTDVISEKVLRETPANKAIFICAQTGSGKTTLVFKKCLPIALSEGKKILYLSSRTSLISQIKEKALRDELNKAQKAGRHKVKDMRKYYTDYGLKELYDFGGMHIMSYQGYIHKYMELDHSAYAFVILDEISFAVSDAPFNVYIEKIVETIICNNYRNRRIYLTATPQECIETIYKKESCFNYKCPNPILRQMDIYLSEENFSHILPSFFKNVDDIIDTILEHDKNQYWLIFVRDKNMGTSIKEKISQHTDDIYFFTAETEKEDSFLQSLIKEEKLPCRVIISTKLLDVGVNINTRNVRIILFEDDIVEATQMIGRKRLAQGEKVNVYFHIPTISSINKRLRNINNNLQKCYQMIGEIKREGLLDCVFPPLYIDNRTVRFNSIHIVKLKYEVQHYEELLSKINQNNNYVDGYINYISEHFPGMKVSPDSLLVSSVQDQIDKLMRKCLNRKLNHEESVKLRIDILSITGDPRQNKSANPGLKIINSVLSKYGYSLISEGRPAQYYIERTTEKGNEE